MEVKKAIEIMLAGSGRKKVEIENLLQISKPSFTNWLQKLDQVKRLIIICEFCGYDLVLTDNKGINIKLTNNSSETNKNSQ